MGTTISVVLIEDNRLVRDGITAMLAAEPDLKVVAAAPDADAALLRVREAKPHVVLVDAALGDHDSHRLVAALTTATPETKVIVMDLLPEPEDVGTFIKAGALGFIAKDATVDDFVATIRSVARGATVVPSALTNALFAHVAKHAVLNGAAAAARDAVRMTQREREVLDLLADGLSNKQIAKRLNIATNTVKGHVHNILEKLALHTRLEVAAYAHKARDSTEVRT
jgi:DNA-binding NarL/FixJ family response regulator